MHSESVGGACGGDAFARPVEVHLTSSAFSKIETVKFGNEVEAHVNASGDARRGDKIAIVDPANAFANIQVGIAFAKVGKIFPVSGDAASAEQAGFGEQEGPCADGSDEVSRFGLLGDPSNDSGLRQLAFVQTPDDEQHVERGVIMKAIGSIHTVSRTCGDSSSVFTDQKGVEGGFAIVETGGRCKDFKGAGEVEDLRILVDVYADIHASEFEQFRFHWQVVCGAVGYVIC